MIGRLLTPLYHWSPTSARAGIERRGLRPTCPTSAMAPGRVRALLDVLAHVENDDDDHETFLAVCLGTSPMAAWTLSGAVSFEPGSAWDLWQVHVGDDDVIYPCAEVGAELLEVRVAGRIPKSRVWHVATRITGPRRLSSRSHAKD